MKVAIKDLDGTPVEIGLEMFTNHEKEQEEMYFWIDTPHECVTINVSDKVLDQLEDVIRFLRNQTR